MATAQPPFQPPFTIRLLDNYKQVQPQPQPQPPTPQLQPPPPQPQPPTPQLQPPPSQLQLPPPQLNDDAIQWLLPASYRKGERGSDVVAASLDVTACIKKELDLKKLHSIWKQMWIVGLPTPPRPLHHQLLLSRDIFLTEQMDMHLVWTTGRMFLKPIPRFLLEPCFWTLHLATTEPCSCFGEDVDPQSVTTNTQGATANTTGAKSDTKSAKKCEGGLRRCALGFLFSYAALITHESDFQIAKEKGLLPEQVTWSAWITLVKQLDTEHIYDKIDERFKYGELRLSRLNKIYRFTRCPLLLHPYMSHWHQYGSLLQDNFTWLASATVYIAIVLTAMQVGLATDRLMDNSSFQSVSYGFTVFAILGPLATAGLIIAICLVLFVDNWVATSRFSKKRSPHVQLWKPATEQTRTVATNVSA